MITNGTVSIEDGVKHAGYPDPQFAPTRRVRVELSFDAPEGEDGQPYLDKTAVVAQAKVQELLGRTIADPVQREAAAKMQAAQTVASVEATIAPKASGKKKAAKEPAKPAELEKTKADLAKEAGLPATDTVHKGDPAPLLEEGEAAAEPEEDGEDLGDLLGDAAPAPITDAELAKAAQHKAALLKQKDPNAKPTKIRELIAEYAGAPPKRITDIPVAKRAEFLAKLNDI